MCSLLSNAQYLQRNSASHYKYSASKTVFFAWLLREVCSFRDSDNWGKHVLKQYRDAREETAHHANRFARLDKSDTLIIPLVNFMINLFYFGIPWTYLAHTEAAFEFRGRLSELEAHWRKYIARLTNEFSHFLLIVSPVIAILFSLLIFNGMESTVLLS
jgi:hypothetical protein